MTARGLRPDDVIVWPDDSEQHWVTTSRPADPNNALDGKWRLITEQLTGLPANYRLIRAEDIDPETPFLLVGWQDE